MLSGDEHERRDDRARLQVDDAVRQIETWTDRTIQSLRITQPVREAAERAWRKARRSRRYGIFRRHTDLQARVLRCMILLAVASDPGLVPRVRELARYYSLNYAWEWLSNGVTGAPRDMARDMILRAGDSEWGEAPLAGALSYVLLHHSEVQLEHVSSYSEAYTLALRLESGGFFRDQAPRQRLRLGLLTQSEKRETALKRFGGRGEKT